MANQTQRKQEAKRIQKSLNNAHKFITRREKQSRWVWTDIHKRVHDNQFLLLALLADAEREIDELWGALYEAMEWNWLDPDIPKDVYERFDEILNKRDLDHGDCDCSACCPN